MFALTDACGKRTAFAPLLPFSQLETNLAISSSFRHGPSPEGGIRCPRFGHRRWVPRNVLGSGYQQVRLLANALLGTL